MPQKSYLGSKTEKTNITTECFIFDFEPYFSFNWQFEITKSKHHHWILNIQISLGRKFKLKLPFWFFLRNLPKQDISGQKTEKVNTTIEFCILKLVWVQNFSLNWQFWCFSKICPKRVFSFKNEKSEGNHRIVNNRINLGMKFDLQLTSLIFWKKNHQKRVFLVENRESEYYHWILHFRISQDTKFPFKRTILNFRPNLPKKDISSLKQRKWTPSLNSAYSAYLRYQISV